MTGLKRKLESCDPGKGGLVPALRGGGKEGEVLYEVDRLSLANEDRP